MSGSVEYGIDFSEIEGFAVEVDGSHLIISDPTGDTHEVGPAEDIDHARELVADAIAGFSYGVATILVDALNPVEHED